MANFEHNTSSQGLFLSIQLEDQFDPDSREYIIKEFIQKNVKIEDFEEEYKNDHTGRKIKNPQDVVAAILYGYITGNRSSRKIEELLKTHIGFMYISNCLKIDHSIICNFKIKFREQIKNVFSKMLYVMNEIEMIDWSIVAGDGTKIKAYASKGQNIGRGFIQKLLEAYHETADKIVERDIELEKDFEEGKIDPKEHDAKKMRIIRQKRKIEKAISKMNKCIEDDETNKKSEKKRVNLTDPDSGLTVSGSKDGYIQGYNALLMLSNNDVVLDFDVITYEKECNYTEELVNGVEELKKDFGAEEESKYLFDWGFQNMEKTLKLEDKGLDMYIDVRERDFCDKSEKRKNFKLINTEGQYKLKCRNNKETKGYWNKRTNSFSFLFDRKKCKGCPFMPECYSKTKETTLHKTVSYYRFEVENWDKIEKYMNKFRSEEGQKIYSKRIGKEHVHANIKNQRNFQQTYYRGKSNVRMDLCWAVLAQNMCRYINYMRK